MTARDENGAADWTTEVIARLTLEEIVLRGDIKMRKSVVEAS